MTDGPTWQTVDPKHRANDCPHDLRSYRKLRNATVCLRCGVAIEPVGAQVLDLEAARQRRARRGKR